MKKQISMLLATACAASLLAACGGSGSTTTDSSSAADTTATAASYYESAQKPDKLVWWVHDGMHQEDGSEQWIAEFDAKTGIDLELDFIDNNEYTKKLELAYASDTVPDTFDLNGETLGNYAAQGAIADLTDLVHESGLWGETLTVRLKQNVPDAEVIALPPIEGATYLYSAPSVQVISSKLSDEQVASVYKYFIEYMHDGGEGQVLFQSGVEGVHWQQSGNNIDPLPTISKPAEPFRKAWITPWLALTPMTATDKNVEVSQEATDSLAVVSANAKNISVFPVSEQRTMITSDLTTTRENIISRVAMGQLTPEEGMAEYKAQAETLNVAQALEEMNANA